MKKRRISYYSFISILLIIITSCSKMELEQEAKGASKTDLSTRADLVEYTINVKTAGTLNSLVEAGNYSDAQKLIITGNIAYKDVKYVDVNMPSVEVLDLAGSAYESESINGVFLSDSTKIKEISLPGNIISISGYYDYDYDSQLEHDFYPFNCNSLTSIILPESVTSIEKYAFYGCSSLINITIPQGVTSIGGGAFEGCSSLTSINIPQGVTSIEECAFYGCSSLINITIPQGVTSIGDMAFEGCSSLASITIPKGVTSIGRGTFEGCSSLASITIPKGVTSIGRGAFNGCRSLISIILPESVTSIEEYAFSGCSSLINITIPQSVTSIGDWAFGWCSSLTNITIPQSVTSIGGYTFYFCSSLTSINIPQGVTSIGDMAFVGCSSLASITIPKGVTSIGYGAFGGCSSLTNITIPENVTSIGRQTFGSCSSLTSINIPQSVTSIGDGAFEGCSSLASITIPKSVRSIGNSAFYYCSSLTSITIPENVTSIGDNAFWGCGSLTSINIPESVTNIGDNVFNGCWSLQKVICNSSGDINDLSYSSNQSCWLIINRPDGNLPMYGPNWQNVVINGVAESVTLSYRQIADFTFPEEVNTIKKISYTMTFNTNFSSSHGIWRTIALPFTPTHITHAEKGALAPFDSGIEGAKDFWLREWTTEGLKDVTLIEPNRPYLIAMPYSEEYDDKYNISGEVTFSAENLPAEYLKDKTPLSAEGTNYTMYASYSYMDKADGVYVLNNDNEFVSDSSPVYSFEAYLKANTATLRSVISLNKGRVATRAGSGSKRKPQIDDM